MAHLHSLPIEISEDGEVFFEGKKCATQRGLRGYSSVRISLHRLVAHAFHGPPDQSRHVCHHKDGNPRNNRPDNLCWITQRENTQLHFRGRPKKLSPKQVNDILSQKPSQQVTSLGDLARAYGVSYSAVRAIRSGVNWKTGWHKHNRAILTSEQIDCIRKWRSQIVTAASLARKFHVSDSTILNIWHGRG